MYKQTTNEYLQFTKSWGRKVTPETMGSALESFFHNGIAFRKDILEALIYKVEEIQAWFEHQNRLRFTN